MQDYSTLRLALTLAAAGLLSGLALVGVYELTLPTITANKAAQLKAAVFEVVPGAASLKRFEAAGDGVVEGEGEANPDTPSVYAGYDESGKLLGYAIPAEGPGFQDVIKLIFGYDPARRVVTGFKVLQSTETPGLGDKIIKDMTFVGAFEALGTEPEIVITGPGASSAANEVDSISGATISSKAVVKIINGGLEDWRQKLAGEAAP